MTALRFTLLAEGSSDRVLLYALGWLLNTNSSRHFTGDWADFSRLRHPPRSLAQKTPTACELFPCDLLFVHRDADRERREDRKVEIEEVLEAIDRPPVVCVIPVRMTEAWFLHDEPALRSAVNRSTASERLTLPSRAVIEALPDPKTVLHDLLRQSAGFSGRRLAAFRPERAVHRLAELIEDYSPLRDLSAFAALENDLRSVLAANDWH